VLGLFFGIALCRHFADSFVIGALLILGAVSVCGLAAGFWGDRSWEALLRIWSGTSGR